MPLPPRRTLLDVRSHGPLAQDAVRIPLSELENRLSELPPKHEAVRIAETGPDAREAARRLEECGRDVELLPFLEGSELVPGRLWDPNPFLLSCLDGERPGNAADVGCGGGRDAVALAGMGWYVTALDRLPDCIERGKELADRYLSEEEAKRIEWEVREASHFSAESFDLVVLAFYFDRQLVESVFDTLLPGGRVLIETFTTIHRENVGKPASDQRVVWPGELRRMAEKLDILRYEEGWLRCRHTARLYARKV